MVAVAAVVAAAEEAAVVAVASEVDSTSACRSKPARQSSCQSVVRTTRPVIIENDPGIN